MTGLVSTAALVCTLLGLVSAAVVLVRTRSPGQALPVLLDFLLAAGLLRLTDDLTWRALVTTAVVVVLRRVVVSSAIAGARRSAAAPRGT